MAVFTGTAADRGAGTAVAATAAAAAAITGLAGLWYMTATNSSSSSSSHQRPTTTSARTNITPSPLTTQIPHLTPAQAAALPYPPGSSTAAALPGGRDVPTAYGSIRVYEWGPEDPAADKVLLVHGISTPCIALGDLAWELVGRGCRVMLFDLFGRGYSDAPNDIPYDARLYTTQMLLVLASSELSWLGGDGSGGGFHLVGYSFGGCLCVSFAAQFPRMLRSLSLVATAGLIRQHHVGRSSRWLYESRILPGWLVRAMVRRRIRPPPPPPSPASTAASDSDSASAAAVAGPRDTSEEEFGNGGGADEDGPEALMLSEATNQQTHPPPSSPGKPDGQSHRGRSEDSTGPPELARSRRRRRDGDASGGAAFDSASLSRSRPDVTVSSVVRWQVDHHAGFVGAFLSTIREAPIFAPSGGADWRALRRILSEESGSNGSGEPRQRKEEAVADVVDGDGVAAAAAAAAAATAAVAPRTGAVAEGAGRGGLAAKGKILIVLGGKDSVIDCAETVADATAILNGNEDDDDGRGENSPSLSSRVEFVILENAGHEIPITASAEVADALVGHWREATAPPDAR